MDVTSGSASPTDVEVELKCQVSPADSEVLLAHGLLGSPSTTRTIRSVYYDTASREVRGAGVSLRVRHVDERRIQTIKADSRSTGLFRRQEWTSRLHGDMPETAALADTPLAALRAADLLPIFEVEVLRTSAIHDDGRGSKVEIAFDRGWVRGSGSRIALCEVEFELKEGSLGTVFDLARRLAASVPMTPSTGSKADVGYALVDRTAGGGADEVGVDPDDPRNETRSNRVAAGIAAIAGMEAALHT